jgi:hypothetical protein
VQRENGSHLVAVVCICLVAIDNTEIRSTRLCCHSLDAGCPWEILTTPRSSIGRSKMAGIYTNVVLHRMEEVTLVGNYRKSVLEITAIVTATTM